MIARARPDGSLPTECARPVQFWLGEREYWNLKVVTELLGEPQYEFLNRAATSAIRGHLTAAEQTKSMQPELQAASHKVAKKRAVRRQRAKASEDLFLKSLQSEVRLRKRSEDL